MQAYYSNQAKDWRVETSQWIDERIAVEQLWNEKRKAAGLEPAPLPDSQFKQQTSGGQDHAAEDDAGTKDDAK